MVVNQPTPAQIAWVIGNCLNTSAVEALFAPLSAKDLGLKQTSGPIPFSRMRAGLNFARY